MKFLLAFGLLASSVFAQDKLAPVDGANLPTVLAAHKGKVVLANFWATWCVPCRKEMPELVKLSQKLAARGFDLVMISADEPAREAMAAGVLRENQAPGVKYLLRGRDAEREKFYRAIDPQWSSEDGSLPALFLYDRTGKKTRAFIGETPVQDIEAAILKLL